MIDIHAHILPGLDDGSPDLECSLAMAELAVESGVTGVAATPHCNMPGRFANYWGKSLRQEIGRFRRELEKAGIRLEIYPGMEIFGTPDVPELLRTGRLTTLGGSRYPLIEFPFHEYGLQATEILREVIALGYRPVVAHPERYRYTQEDPMLLNRWVGMGCLLQLNKGSLLGRFGRSAEALAISLIDRGFAAAVASDAHSPAVRTTWMLEVWDLLCAEYSENAAKLLLEENPRRLLQNEEIENEEPEWF